jgi:hypothetical protein
VAVESGNSYAALFESGGGLRGPAGSTYDAAGNLYFVASTATPTGQINVYHLTGGSITRVARDGTVTKLVDWPAGSAGAMAPVGLTLGPDGTFHFLDQLSGNLVAWTAQGGTRMVARLRSPQPNSFFPTRLHLLVTPQNTLYVMDRNLLKRVDNGVVTVVAGTVAGTLPGGDTGYGTSEAIDGAGTGAQFARGGHMVLDAEGNILVADSATIRRITPAGVVTTIAGIFPAAGTLGGTFPPLQTGALPGSLGADVGALAIGTDRVVRAFVNPDSASLPGGTNQHGQQTLITIRFQ